MNPFSEETRPFQFNFGATAATVDDQPCGTEASMRLAEYVPMQWVRMFLLFLIHFSLFLFFCCQAEPLPAFKVETVPCGSVSFQKVIFDPAIAATLPGLAGSEFIDAASKSDVVSGVYEGESLNVFLGYIFRAAHRWAQDVGMHC
jgi:hypothetical protein